ncbi:Uncharacterised protein [[Ruminococcus] torques]|uniref:Uncharacterized protein n=1 Tax=[Ruminococcus] torques TaxID=33039 RepID=A0A564U7X2_9FIRM|nr:Uncharacterised protein [[Ruminococcus] torques]
MWIFYAIDSSFFAGITAVLAKCGIKKTDSDVFLREGITGTKIVSVLLIGIEGIDSNLGTAIRTTVVLLMVFVTGKQKEIKAAAGVLLITAGTVLLAII